MRRAAKVDRNQAEIVEALRKAGASIQVLSGVGHGFPDLLVARPGELALPMEVKMPGEDLTEMEQEWFANWGGRAAIVYSIDDALRLLTQANIHGV